MALAGPWRNDDLFLGSVKDNIGHAEAASGVAAVIKTLLMMQYKTVPKQANFVSLSPRIKVSPSNRIIVPQTTQPWTAQRHVALVNNYGAAGSNAALIIRAYSDVPGKSTETQSRTQEGDSSTVYPILLSAKSANSLHSYMNELTSWLPKVGTSLGSIAYNLARSHNSSFDHRVAFTAADKNDLLSALTTSTTASNENMTRSDKYPVVLCFGGQTGRNVTISKELYENCDLLRIHLVSTPLALKLWPN